MDAQLLGKLTRAEEDLISAMLIGDGDLTAFDISWSSLLDEVSQASVSGNINEATLAVADDLVARVATLVDCFLSLSSTPSPSFPTLDRNTDSPSPSSFIPEAYAWLLKNIANPYPPIEFKVFLAERHNSQVTAISSWFTNARRRIGWTTLCRDFFRNCRADAVDAAHRVLVKGDSDYQLGAEVVHAFVSMKVAAEELCAPSPRCILTGALDAAVKNILNNDEPLVWREEPGRMGYPGVPNKCTRRSRTCTPDEIVSQKNPIMQTIPDLLHPSYFGDSPMRENEEDRSRASLLFAGREWRSLPLESARVNNSVQPMKSPRATCLPSASPHTPSTSTKDPSENDSSDNSSYSTQSPTRVVNSRKRRLSDPHPAEMSKRLRHSIAGSCLHTSYNPHPLSATESEHTIDDWFKANFDSLFALPPIVELAEPDFSTQWEVGLFNDYTLLGNAQDGVTTPIPGGGTSSPTNLTMLDDLLQLFSSNGSPASSQSIHSPQSMPDASTVSQNLPTSPDLSESIDWTSLFNGSFGTTSDSIFSQYSFSPVLPDIDFSVLRAPDIWSTVAS